MIEKWGKLQTRLSRNIILTRKLGLRHFAVSPTICGVKHSIQQKNRGLVQLGLQIRPLFDLCECDLGTVKFSYALIVHLPWVLPIWKSELKFTQWMILTFNPCHGKLPRRKYINMWPKASKSSRRLCSAKTEEKWDEIFCIMVSIYGIITIELMI